MGLMAVRVAVKGYLQAEIALMFVCPVLKACQILRKVTGKTQKPLQENKSMQKCHSDIIMAEQVIMAFTESSQPGSSVSLFFLCHYKKCLFCHLLTLW